jgi:hypothetical protein
MPHVSSGRLPTAIGMLTKATSGKQPVTLIVMQRIIINSKAAAICLMSIVVTSPAGMAQTMKELTWVQMVRNG